MTATEPTTPASQATPPASAQAAAPNAAPQPPAADAATKPPGSADTPSAAAPTDPHHPPATANAHAGPPKKSKIKEILAKVGGLFKAVKNLPKDLILGLKDAIWSGGWPLRLAVVGFGVSLFIVVKTGQRIWSMYKKEAALHVQQLAGGSHLGGKVSGKEEKADDEEDEEIVPAHGFFIERMVGSLASPLGESKAFEIDLYVESADEESKKILENRRHALQELIEFDLQNQHPDLLMTEKGKQELKDRILKHINQLLEKEFKNREEPPKALRIFFTRFVLA